MNKKVSVIFFIICCTLLCIIPNYCYATTTTKTVIPGLDRAPRVSYDRTNEKYFKIELKELGKIYFVKLEKVVDGKTTILLNRDNDSKNDKTTNGITISSDKKEIKIPKTLFKEDEYTRLKLTASDSSSPRKNQIISILLIKNRKTIDAAKGWYELNNSPRLAYSGSFTITATDGSKIRSVTVKDINNKNASVSIGSQLSGSTDTKKSYKINLKNLKADNNKYRIRVRAVDQTGIARVEEVTINTEKKTFNSEDKITYKSVNRATVMKLDRTNQDNLIINLEDKEKVTAVKLEKIKNGATVLLQQNANTNKNDKAITVSSDKKQIKINKSLLKEDAFTEFRLTTIDENDNEFRSIFKAKLRKTKDDTKGWYEINASPRLSYAKGFKITVRDDGKIKSLLVKDKNNNYATVSVGTRLSGSTDVKEIYKIDLSKLVDKNNKYNLRIIAEDKTGMVTTEEIIVNVQKETPKKQTTTSTGGSSTSTGGSSTSTGGSSTSTGGSSTSTGDSSTSTGGSSTTTGCNHSYGRLYTENIGCQTYSYYICSKCGYKNTKSSVTKHNYSAIKILKRGSSTNGYNEVIGRRCTKCGVQTNVHSRKCIWKTNKTQQGCKLVSTVRCKNCNVKKSETSKISHSNTGATYSTITLQAPSKSNKCTKRTGKRCNRCGKVVSSNTIKDCHDLKEINRLTVGNRTRILYKCKVCGAKKYINI